MAPDHTKLQKEMNFRESLSRDSSMVREVSDTQMETTSRANLR